MPNWCDNTLTVTGSKKELDKFKAMSIGNDNFRLSGIIPTPEELLESSPPSEYRGDDEEGKIQHEKRIKELLEKYEYSHWYDWRIANWGTKWDISDEMQNVLVDDDNEFKVNFSSAWSPPTDWLIAAASKFKSLEFKLSFMEEGMGFCGCYSIIDGIKYEEDAEIEYEDEDGNKVEKEGDNWVYSDTREIAGDEDFWPTAVNPFE